MGFYSRIIFPRLVNWGMSCGLLSRLRRELLAQARGRVLEVGFGTGLNLPFYPRDIESLTAVDPNPGMLALSKQRLEYAPFEVKTMCLNGERLPLPDGSFDTVVTTWTLCSVANVTAALGEIHRLVTADGQFLFIEHGRSPDSGVRRWQDRLNPIHKLCTDGCNLNRDIKKLIDCSGLRVEALDQFYLERTPRYIGYTYRGVATRMTRDEIHAQGSKPPQA